MLLGLPIRSDLIGAIAGVVMVFAVDFIEWIRVDDPIGAVAVHGFCGIWGTLGLGLFATGQFGLPGPTGADMSAPIEGLVLRRWHDAARIAAHRQATGIIACVRCRRWLLMYGVKALGVLRISPEGTSSRASTSSSTVRPPTTPSPPTRATRRSRPASAAEASKAPAPTISVGD